MHTKYRVNQDLLYNKLTKIVCNNHTVAIQWKNLSLNNQCSIIKQTQSPKNEHIVKTHSAKIKEIYYVIMIIHSFD